MLQLRDWLADKMAASHDETYRDAKNLHSKYMRHQAFEAEIAANKDRLTRVLQEGEDIMTAKPETREQVCPKQHYILKQGNLVTWKKIMGKVW